MSSGALPGPSRNADTVWAEFDPEWYWEHNFRSVHPDDRAILELTRDFFARRLPPGVDCAVDVGTGSNLYPALLLLPFARRLDLVEYAPANVDWLRGAVKDCGPEWDGFWAVLAADPAYAALADPRARLREVAEIVQASVFDLPERHWDAGTLFFVACSLSSGYDEFERAVGAFLGALRPGAPFAMAFMRGSHGYPVGDTWFPAVSVDEADVAECVGPLAADVAVHSIEFADEPLRAGYTGMILALGSVR